MPMHDWDRVPAEIFHAFHHNWISEIGRALNRGSLPGDFYALPQLQDFPLPYAVAVHHVNEDRFAAWVEILSPRHKASRHTFQAFLKNARKLREQGIHFSLIDPFPPGPHDPNGIHAAIWEEVENKPFELPNDKPLTQAAYECGLTTRAYIEPFAVGDVLSDLPLFLEENGHVLIPLEPTYQMAFAGMPQRWREVLEASEPS